MRQVISILLAVILLPAIFGLTINRHYCHDELVSSQVTFVQWGEQSNTCPVDMDKMLRSCNMEDESHSCPYCHDDKTDIQIKDSFLMNFFKFKLYSDVFDSFFVPVKIKLFKIFSADLINAERCHDPPVKSRPISFLMSFLL